MPQMIVRTTLCNGNIFVKLYVRALH